MLSRQLTGRIKVKTDRGIGRHKSVDEEVVFIGAAFFADGLMHSTDPSKPWCYDKSREGLLQLLLELRKEGQLDEFGLDGPAVKYVIPGIPYPKDDRGTGNQEEDTGGHVSFWCRPGYAANGTEYTAPDLAMAKQIDGQEVKLTLLPPAEGLKILVGSENNDMETGICYYINLSFDDDSTKIAYGVRAKVGLEPDATQKFHLTLAGAAPAWQEVHPKSLAYREADEKQKKIMNPEEDFQVFRKGIPGSSFVGFDADRVTGWSRHAARAALMGRENARISKEVAALENEKPSPERDVKILTLNSQKQDTKMLGYPKAITKGEAITRELKSALPGSAAQEDIMKVWATKRELVRQCIQRAA